MTKNNRGGKRKGAGRPKLGRDKLLTVRLSPTTIETLGPRPAAAVRFLIERIVGNENSGPNDVWMRPQSERGKPWPPCSSISFERILPKPSVTQKKSANLVKD